MVDINCTLPRPSIQDLHAQATAELSTRFLGGAPVLPMSNEDVLAAIMAGFVNLAHGYVTQALKESDPRTMCCDNLVVYAANAGINLKDATRAKGYVSLTGTPGTAIPINIRFIGPASREYKLDPAVVSNPVTLGANGNAALRVVSVDAGAAYNLPAGTQLTVGSTVAGINTFGTVSGSGLSGGSEPETCEQLRTRVLAAQATGIISTNDKWYVGEALAWPGATRVCSDACVSCENPGYLILYPFFDGVYPPYGVPPQAVLDEMTRWMFGTNAGMGEGVAPLGSIGVFRAAVPSVMNVTVNCFSGCGGGMAEAIKAALTDWLMDNACVGSTICKQHMRQVISDTLGSEACSGTITLAFDGTLLAEDDANICLACEHFLTVGYVTVIQG